MLLRKPLPIVLALVLAFALSPQTYAGQSASASAHRNRTTVGQVDNGLPGARESADTKEPEGIVTMQKAVLLALSKNFKLMASSQEVGARDAAVLQKRLLPNPKLAVEVENILGDNQFRDYEQAETTIWLSQRVELGGKRSKRTLVATLGRDLAEWDYTAKKQDTVTETTKAFIDVLAAQELVRLTEEIVRLARQSFETAAARVEAGKASPIDETKASAALSMTQIEHRRSQRFLNVTRKRLAAMWGNSIPLFTRAEGRLEEEISLASYDDLVRRVSANPDIARWSTTIKQRGAALQLEKAGRIPDPVFAVGVRQFNVSDDTAYVAGMTIPLPLFNRNQGSVREAVNRLAKAEEEQKDAVVRTRTALSETYEMLSNALHEASTLKSDVLPALQGAFSAIQEGYRYGKFGYLDVLDAQRTLFKSKIRHVEALAAYRKAAADMERLTGMSVREKDSLRKDKRNEP